MKKNLMALLVLALILVLTGAGPAVAKSAPAVTIRLLNSPGDVLIMSIGETYTFDIQVKSETEFISATAMSNPYYPGKGIAWRPSSDHVTKATSTKLHLTLVARGSTGDLPQVCGWFPSGECSPAGSAPQMIQVGVRLQGGEVVSQVFPFSVIVQP